MGPVSALLLTICLVNLVSPQSTVVDNGQCDAIIVDLAENSKAMEADVHRLREELVRVYTVIEEMRQMLKEIHSTTVNVSSLHCPEEFLHSNSNLGSCYFISKTKLRWDDAVEDCIRRGSYLAEIQSKEENDYLGSLTAGTVHWLGGTDFISENMWVWKNSGVRFTYSNWRLGDPDGGRLKNCLLLWVHGKLADMRCSSAFNYICEFKGQ